MAIATYDTLKAPPRWCGFSGTCSDCGTRIATARFTEADIVVETCVCNMRVALDAQARA
jgi:hypothetical protein